MAKYKFAWLTAMALSVVSAQAKNVLPNGDFESGFAGWNDTLWRYNASTTVAGKLSLDSAAPHGGKADLKVAVTQVNSSNNWYMRLYLPTFKAIKGATYHLSFWAKSAAASSLNLGIDSVSKYKSASGFSTGTAWKQYTFKYTAAATGDSAVNFSVYMSSLGTFYFDDFTVDEEAPVVLKDTMLLPSQGAWYTGKYRNLFVERGYDADTVQNRLKAAYNQLFLDPDTAAKSVMKLVPGDSSMAFVQAADASNAANSDIRSEGQSYGMIISVMMDRKDIFNKLWKFAKTYSQHHSDSSDLQGLFRWSLQTYPPYHYRGTYGYTPAPDGEEYYAAALFLASKRWGDSTGWYAYGTQADSLLYYMRKKRKSNFSPIDSSAKQILFSATSGTKFTDASYHLPAFYRMWGAFTKNADGAFYRQMADTSVAFLKRHMHAVTGLCSDYANLDGTPHLNGYSTITFNGTSYTTDTIYYSDSHRCSMNIAVDWAWFQADPWETTQTRKELGFFYGQGGATSYKQDYTRSGTAVASYSASQSQIGANGAAVLASDTARDWAFVDALYGIDVPSGNYRYYNGLIYLLGYLHAAGEFKAYGSPGLSAPAAIEARNGHSAAFFTATLHGQVISLSGLSGTTVRLLNTQGRQVVQARVISGKASLTAPSQGLWIVESAKASRSIAIP